MKHGGHMCNMVDDQITLECTSRSSSVIQKSKYNYPDHNDKLNILNNMILNIYMTMIHLHKFR